jgi:HEAT repeat protein
LGVVVALVAGAAARSAQADQLPPAQPGDTITWVKGLPKAFEEAAKQGLPLMICINSERVDGGRVEAAAKELREVTYKDPRVVGTSRGFIVAWLTAEGSSDDFGELRARFKIEGLIVSPQHIFAYPDGTLIDRHEYWPHGTGERSTLALLDLMDKALAKHKVAKELGPAAPATPAPTTPAPGEAPPAAPPGGDPAAPAPGPGDAGAVREKLLEAVEKGSPEARREALRRLLADDADGANVRAILALLPKLDEAKAIDTLIDVVRALGKHGLKDPEKKDVALALAGYLDHKDEGLRGNAAVSLEYVGAPEAVDALKGRLDREKVELIHCHLLRALGRCGAGDSKVRAVLDRRVTSAKTEPLSCAAIVGLAYFEKDAAAARTLEEQLQKVGPPAFGRRGGGGENSLKRAFLAWALAEVGDKKSGDFMRKKMLPSLDNVADFGGVVTRVRDFYDAVADVCEGSAAGGNAEAKAVVDGSIQWVIGFYGNPLHDDLRRNRDSGGFTPKADWDTPARPGGGAPGPGGMPPGGGGR